MRARRRLVLLAMCGLLPLACNSGSERPENEAVPADVVPRDAYLYVEGNVRLRGESGVLARRFATKLAGGRRIPDSALVDLVAGALEVEIDFDDELAPWLGNRGAVFAIERGDGADPVALVVETTDTSAATRFFRNRLGQGLTKAVYAGVPLWRAEDGRAFSSVRGRAVLGSSAAAVHAAIDARRKPLSADPRYRRARGTGVAPLAFAIAESERARELVDDIRTLSAADRRSVRERLPRTGDVGVSLAVTERQAALRLEELRPFGKQAEPIASIPGDAWFAASTADIESLLTNPLGAEVGQRFSLRRALAGFVGAELPTTLIRQFRGGTVYLQGRGAGAGGELLVQVQSRRAATRGMREYSRALQRTSGKTVEVFRSQRADFGILTYEPGRRYLDAPLTETFLNGRQLSLVFGPIGSSVQLKDTPVYREASRALGERPTTLLDMRGFLDVVDPTRAREPGTDERIKFLAIAETRQGDRLRWTFLVRLARRAVRARPTT
jgi:hypothetical protein